MQLDTNVKSLLDMLAASGQPKLWELTPVDARKMALELTRMVEGKEAIGKIENGTLPGPGGPLPFPDLYAGGVSRQAARRHRLFSRRGLDFWRSRHPRWYVPNARQRERLPRNFDRLSFSTRA